jgi:serine/threonine protein kinase
MQGYTIGTGRDGDIRIIEYIKGKTLFDKIENVRRPHEAYFTESLPSLLRLFIPCLEALDFIHSAGLRHGDIRTDHLILDSETEHLRWIDFDYDFVFNEAPYAVDLLGVGNILGDLVGKGQSTIHNLRFDKKLAGSLEKLEPGDFSMVEPGRLMNWRKLYPYIPEELNRILMLFSAGAELYYESVAEIAEDLQEAMNSIMV